MRIASSIVSSVQQTQIRDRNDIDRKNDRSVEKQQKNGAFLESIEKQHGDKIAQIKESIKNGSYKINLAATSEKMAQSLLNL